MTELKPCPFCGGCGHVYEDGRLSIKPYNFPKWYITCKKCGVKTPTAKIEQVVRIWNRRVNDDAMDMAIEALKCSETPKSSEQNAETIQYNHIAESGRMVERTGKPSQDVSDSDLISRKAAVEALARMMPRSYTPDGSHPADEEIFRAQEIFADCIEALEILPSSQPETARRIVGKSRDGMTLWYQCDMCNEPVDAQDNFCRGCGRRLTDE